MARRNAGIVKLHSRAMFNGKYLFWHCSAQPMEEMPTFTSSFIRSLTCAFHQGMADEAELRLTARALAVEPGIRVGGALMSVVGAALAVEIAFAVAPMG